MALVRFRPSARKTFLAAPVVLAGVAAIAALVYDVSAAAGGPPDGPGVSTEAEPHQHPLDAGGF